MNGTIGLVALVIALLAACVFLLWRYTGWERRMRAVTTALLCVVVAVVVVPALAAPRGEFTVQRVSGLEAVPPQETVLAAVAAIPESYEFEMEASPAPDVTPSEAPSERDGPADDLPEELPPPAPEESAPPPSESPENVTVRNAPSYYILNTSTKKFHLPTCSDAGRIKAENRATIETRQGAVDGGYVACKRCKP